MSVYIGTKAYISFTCNFTQVIETATNFLHQIDLSTALDNANFYNYIVDRASLLVCDDVGTKLPSKIIVNKTTKKLIVYFDGPKSSVANTTFYLCVSNLFSETDSSTAFTNCGINKFFGFDDDVYGFAYDYVDSTLMTGSNIYLNQTGQFYKSALVSSTYSYGYNNLSGFTNATNMVISITLKRSLLGREKIVINYGNGKDRIETQLGLGFMGEYHVPNLCQLTFANGRKVTSETLGTDGQFHNYTIVYDGSLSNEDRIKLYYDGVLKESTIFIEEGYGSDTIPTTLSSTEYKLYIGQGQGTGWAQTGYYDDVYVMSTTTTGFITDRQTMIFSPATFYTIGSNVTLVEPTPTIVIDTSPLSFGPTYINHTDTKTVSIENDGLADLNITVSSNNSDFTLSDTTLNISPHVTSTLDIIYSSNNTSVDNGIITLTTNDPINPTVTINVSGECKENPLEGAKAVIPFYCNKSRVTETASHFLHQIDLSIALNSPVFKSYIVDRSSLIICDKDGFGLPSKILLDLENDSLFVYFDGSKSTDVNTIFYLCCSDEFTESDSDTVFTNNAITNYLPLDSDTRDIASSDVWTNGGDVGFTTTSTKFNGAAVFSGYPNIASSIRTNNDILSTGNATISFNFKRSSNQWYHDFFDASNDTFYCRWYCSSGYNGSYGMLIINNVMYATSSSMFEVWFDINTWYNITISRTSTGYVTLYVNGELIGTKYVGNTRTAGAYYISQWYVYNSGVVDGLIDEFCVSSKLTTDGEAKDRYRAIFEPDTFYYIGIPIITVDSNPLDFGDVIINLSNTKTITIGSDGDTELVVTISSDNPIFIPSESVITIPPGTTEDLTITFSPTSLGSKVGTLTLTTNDPLYPSIDIDMSGNCIELPSYIRFIATPTYGKIPLSVNFTSSTSNLKNVGGFMWDFGDGTTSLETSPTHIYTKAGSYTVSLIAYDTTTNINYTYRRVKYINTYEEDTSSTNFNKCFGFWVPDELATKKTTEE